jgi:hypothetical protein
MTELRLFEIAPENLLENAPLSFSSPESQ